MIALEIRFWKIWRSIAFSAVHDRQLRETSTSTASGRAAAGPSAHSTSRTTTPTSTGLALELRASGPRVVEQVVDERLHALDAGDDEVDEAVGVLVQAAAVAAGEQVDKAGDDAQRLGEIVGGHVGELLEVAV